MSTDAEFEKQCVSSMRTYLAFKEAQYAEIMRLAHEYAICDGEQLISRKVKGPEAAALVRATQASIAALDAAVRKLAGLTPADSETTAPVRKV